MASVLVLLFILVFMDKTSILVWNVRGINDKGRRDNIRKVVHDFRPSVVCLLETKLSHISDHDVASFLGREFSEFVFRPAQRTRGGARAFLLLGEMDHSLSTTISSTAIQFQFFSAAVMDPHGG